MTGGSNRQLTDALLFGPLLSIGRQQFGNVLVKPNQADLLVLKELCETGKVRPVIDRRFPLSEVSCRRPLRRGRTCTREGRHHDRPPGCTDGRPGLSSWRGSRSALDEAVNPVMFIVTDAACHQSYMSSMGRTSDSHSNSGQWTRCSSMNSRATASASSFVFVSTSANPPMISFVSANGPSITCSLPPSTGSCKPVRPA